MNAQQLKNAILQEAIEGRLVPQDPNDEPASILLERIRAEKERLVKEGKLKKKDLEVKPISEDEIPFEIPESWEWVRMSSLIQLLSGQDFPPEKYNSNKSGIPYITGASNISNGNLIINRWTELPSVIGKQGDLLIVCKGSGVGKMCVCDIPKIHVARQIQIIRPLSSSVLMEYIKLVVNANLQTIVSRAQGVIPGISRGDVLDLFVPLPPLAEQKRIVEKIEGLLPKVEKYGKAQDELNKLNEELPERLKKSILQEAIEGRLVPQDPNDEPASVLLEKIREEKKQLVKAGKLKKKDLEEKTITEDEIPFEIPESWECIKLSSITSLLDGEKCEGNHVCLDAKYLRGKSTGDILTKGRFVKKTDNIILVDGENSGEVFTVPCDGYMGSTFKQLWVSKSMCLPYVLFFIKFYKDILRNSKKGAAIPHLNKDIFNNLIVGIPPLAEQKRIVAKIEQLLGEIDKLKC